MVKLHMPQTSMCHLPSRNLHFRLYSLVVLSSFPVFPSHFRDCPPPPYLVSCQVLFSLPLNTLDPTFPAWMLVIAFFFFCFFWVTPWRMEVPRLGVKSELQLLTDTTATATWDLSLICDLHHSSQQCWILNPPSEARNQTLILMDIGRVG